MAELKPCPFCGGKPTYQKFNVTIPGRIICACGAEMRQAKNQPMDELVEIWNMRTERICTNDGYYIDGTRFKCSECGYNGWVKWAKDGKDKLPNHCPNCGAKVVV